VLRNIIFDWSGTLVDDLPAVWRATNFVFNQAGVAEMTIEQFRAEFCLPFTLFYDRYIPHVALPQLETWFHGHFRQVQDSVVELPHAREFLLYCRERGLRTFLLSTVHQDHFAAQIARNQATGVPRRHQLSWSPEEDARLRKAFDAGQAIGAIAAAHERKAGAITARLIGLGLITEDGVVAGG